MAVKLKGAGEAFVLEKVPDVEMFQWNYQLSAPGSRVPLSASPDLCGTVRGTG